MIVDNLVNVLGHIETIAPTHTGLLAFGEDGGIFVELGRICWVVARGTRRRLHEILQGYARSDADFDAIYQRCRANGKLLGEVLVDEGHVSAEELEVALRQHSAESLVALCEQGDELPPLRWLTRGEQGYKPRFTFRPLDVLLDAIAIAAPDRHELANRELARVDGPDRFGGAFELGPQAPPPVAALGRLGIVELAELGRTGARLPRSARELGVGVEVAFTTTRTGQSVVAWWRDSLLCVVRCPSRAGLADLLARLEAAG